MKKLPITFFANVEPWIRKPQNHTDIKFHNERSAGDHSGHSATFFTTGSLFLNNNLSYISAHHYYTTPWWQFKLSLHIWLICLSTYLSYLFICYLLTNQIMYLFRLFNFDWIKFLLLDWGSKISNKSWVSSAWTFQHLRALGVRSM